MIVIRQPSLLKEYLIKKKHNNLTIGFVPTMGALHEGHKSLIQTSMAFCNITVCSVFVNPTQFNDPTDFSKYPQRHEEDIQLLENTGAHVVFMPPVSSIYPEGTSQLEHYDLGYLETILEGHYRPGHFQGVLQVMNRLLDMVSPNVLFMGQKDYQQCMVIQLLLQKKQSQTRLQVCPTMREPDGLAMSSRNLRLTPQQRAIAPAIYASLIEIKNHLQPGDLSSLKNKSNDYLQEKGLKVEYFEIATADDLHSIKTWDGVVPLVALVAAFNGEVRLIDNMLLTS
jgi:pantoate--beta-alanine ligase